MWLAEPLLRWGVLVGLAIIAMAGVPVFVQHLIATVLAILGLEGLSALAERLVGKPALSLWGIGLAMGLAAWLGAGRMAPQQPFPFGSFIALGIWLVWL